MMIFYTSNAIYRVQQTQLVLNPNNTRRRIQFTLTYELQLNMLASKIQLKNQCQNSA